MLSLYHVSFKTNHLPWLYIVYRWNCKPLSQLPAFLFEPKPYLLSVTFLHKQGCCSCPLIWMHPPEHIYYPLSYSPLCLECVLSFDTAGEGKFFTFLCSCLPSPSTFPYVFSPLSPPFIQTDRVHCPEKKDISTESTNENIRGVKRSCGIDKRFGWIAGTY